MCTSTQITGGWVARSRRDEMGMADFSMGSGRRARGSSQPFHFKETLQEAAVQQAFETGLGYGKLDAFLDGTGTQAFLVIRDDTLLYERYFMGYQRDSIVTSCSVAKSFDSALVGMAVQDGYIKSVDEVCKVGDHISVKLIAIDDQDRWSVGDRAFAPALHGRLGSDRNAVDRLTR